MDEPDDFLLKRAAGGERAAADELIQRYANLVHGVALRQTRDPELSADISQAVFIVFLRRIATVRHARALPGWFLSTTRFAVRDATRAVQRRRHHEQQAARPELIMDCPGSNLDQNLGLVDDAIASLSRSDGNLILARYFQQHEVAQIATHIGISEQTARKRIARAIERMRRFLANRGATMSVTGVTGLLAAAGSHSAPAAIVEASILAGANAGGSILAGTIAKGTMQWMLLAKLQLAASIAAVAVSLAAVAAVVQLQTAPPARAAAPTSAPSTATARQPRQPNEMLAELSAQYALTNSEVLRLIRAPFPIARAVWADIEYPYARGSDNIRSLGFQWSNGEIRRSYMSYANMTLEALIDIGLGIPWFRVEGLERVKWAPIQADLVVRESASPEEKLHALAILIGDVTGQRAHFLKMTQPRYCVMLVRSPAQSGVVDVHEFDRDGKSLDAPFIRAADGWENPMIGIPPGRTFRSANVTLRRTEPDYEIRLREAVAKIQEQNGGEWRVERRDIEVFVLELGND